MWFYISKQEGAISPSQYSEAIKLWNCCIANRIQISAAFLESKMSKPVAQQALLPGLRMGVGLSNPSWNISEMGTSTDGSVHHIHQQEVSLILLKRRPKSPLFGRHLSASLDRGPVLHIHSNTTNAKSDEQDRAKQDQGYPCSTDLTDTSLVSLPASPVYPTGAQASNGPSTPLPGCRSCASPPPTGPPSPGMAPSWFMGLESTFLTGVQILLNSKRELTLIIYLQKWKRFNSWCHHQCLKLLLHQQCSIICWI